MKYCKWTVDYLKNWSVRNKYHRDGFDYKEWINSLTFLKQGVTYDMNLDYTSDYVSTEVSYCIKDNLIFYLKEWFKYIFKRIFKNVTI